MTPEGRRLKIDTISKIQNWPVPKTLTEMRSFLGFVKAYRMFISGFSTIAEPLNKLTRKGVRFEWTDTQQESFTKIIGILLSDQVLSTPDFKNLVGRPFIVTTDASDVAVGAELSQKDANGNVRPIRWLSKTLSESERKYSSLKKEALAVLYAFRQLEPYLRGQKFILRTDSSALVYLFNKVDFPDAVMSRWMGFIRLYDFVPEHIAGKKNCVADVLSRTDLRSGNEEEEPVEEFLTLQGFADKCR
jgi:RNase H-like domain found in reverse transcriptase